MAAVTACSSRSRAVLCPCGSRRQPPPATVRCWCNCLYPFQSVDGLNSQDMDIVGRGELPELMPTLPGDHPTPPIGPKWPSSPGNSALHLA